MSNLVNALAYSEGDFDALDRVQEQIEAAERRTRQQLHPKGKVHDTRIKVNDLEDRLVPHVRVGNPKSSVADKRALIQQDKAKANAVLDIQLPHSD